MASVCVESALPSSAPLDVPVHKTALVIIDMQADFVTDGGFGAALGNDVKPLRQIIPKLQTMLETARACGMTVVHTVESHPADLSNCPPTKVTGPRAPPAGKTIGDTAKYADGTEGRILIQGEPGCAIVPELAPAADEHVVYKPGKGAFYDTGLHEWLQARGITHLLVGGVTTEVCVQTTCREANDRGYEVCLLEDGAASYFPEFHQSVCDMVVAQGGIVGWTAKIDAVCAPLLKHTAAAAEMERAKRQRTKAGPADADAGVAKTRLNRVFSANSVAALEQRFQFNEERFGKAVPACDI